ncbi:hypothetical protein ACFQDG_15385 [Natronoarchaeum mannanilyticum]|uniref:Twin-arginine translocation signal domain-containing protein n=1 Tax=Natronoarchaeum mannanilyticum TaxID=926360 RepID=A0AAV3T7Y3_9EURY
MTDDFSARRRKLLQSAGAGGTALLAGCTEQLGLAQNSDEGGDGQREAGVVAMVDQQALQQAQLEAQQAAQQDNVSQQEAQQDYRETQQELISEAISSLVDELESNTSATVEQEYSQFGAVRISGSASALIDALEIESSQSLVAAARLEEATSGSTNSS